MVNLLNLKRSEERKVIYVEKTVYRAKPTWLELAEMLLVLLAVSLMGWGLTKAQGTYFGQSHSKQERWSGYGQVISIDQDNLTLNTKDSSNTVNISFVLKIETKSYNPLTISDIQVNDTVIVQGYKEDSNIFAKRIIDFTVTSTTTEEVATSTATTTEVVATSTEPIATSTEAVVITTESIATSTEEMATSTATTTSETATSTELNATTTETLILPLPPQHSN
jgi:hypothetical protein